MLQVEGFPLDCTFYTRLSPVLLPVAFPACTLFPVAPPANPYNSPILTKPAGIELQKGIGTHLAKPNPSSGSTMQVS